MIRLTDFLKSLKDRVQPQQKQEWSEEDVAMLDSAIAFVEHSAFTTIGKGKNNVIVWLKSIRDKAQPQPQPRQEWSEEDERMRQCLIQDQEEALDKINNDKYGHSEIISDLKEMYRERIAWFKSIKDRVVPNTYTEWSEEDCKQIETIACHLDNIGNGAMAESLFNIMDKYKSYELHNTWKPSEEQLDALKQAKNCEGNYYHTNAMLESLYGDLKKLI